MDRRSARHTGSERAGRAPRRHEGALSPDCRTDPGVREPHVKHLEGPLWEIARERERRSCPGDSSSRQPGTQLRYQGLKEACGSQRSDCEKSLEAPTTPTSATVWTLACVFRAPDTGYDGMVRSVEAALNLKYQPDERAANMNQVFFADPAKPSRRVFVGRIGDTTVRVAVVRPRISPSPRRSGMASTLRSRPYNRAAPRRRPVEWASLKSRMTPRTL